MRYVMSGDVRVQVPIRRGHSYLVYKAPPKKHVRKYVGKRRCSRTYGGQTKKRAFIHSVCHRLGLSRKLHELYRLEKQLKPTITNYAALVRAYREVSRLCAMLPPEAFDAQAYTGWTPEELDE